jgi:DnaA family protein
MLFSPQIPLQLEPRRSGGFEDFVAGPNAATVQSIRTAVKEAGSSLFLHGPESSGKSHLLNAACLEAREQGMTAFYLGLKTVPADATETLQGLEGMSLVCIDDLHEVAGDPPWEEALFHFINRLRATEGRLLVASRLRLSALPLQLPDLASRLAWGLRLELQALDDTDKLQVLCRHAEAMGFELPEEVGAYLIRHSDRGLARLLVHADRLRQMAFTEKRRITVPLARLILKET